MTYRHERSSICPYCGVYIAKNHSRPAHRLTNPIYPRWEDSRTAQRLRDRGYTPDMAVLRWYVHEYCAADAEAYGKRQRDAARIRRTVIDPATRSLPEVESAFLHHVAEAFGDVG